MSSAICFNLDQSKILSSGNGLRKSCKYIKDVSEKSQENRILIAWQN